VHRSQLEKLLADLDRQVRLLGRLFEGIRLLERDYGMVAQAATTAVETKLRTLGHYAQLLHSALAQTLACHRHDVRLLLEERVNNDGCWSKPWDTIDDDEVPPFTLALTTPPLSDTWQKARVRAAKDGHVPQW
jgi:hypothetical protein